MRRCNNCDIFLIVLICILYFSLRLAHFQKKIVLRNHSLSAERNIANFASGRRLCTWLLIYEQKMELRFHVKNEDCRKQIYALIGGGQCNADIGRGWKIYCQLA